VLGVYVWFQAQSRALLLRDVWGELHGAEYWYGSSYFPILDAKAVD
jgi:hypothetical protein